MSAPDTDLAAASVPVRLTCAALAAELIELAALRDRTQVLKALAARRGLRLPPLGHLAIAREGVTLCVRPERWLLLTEPGTPGAALASWREPARGCAIAVEHSSALTALLLEGPAVREVLARGCRLDLHPDAFMEGNAAATIMAQVPVLLAALPAGWLLLTPASTARHFREWLTATAGPFGLVRHADVTVGTVFGEHPA